MRRLPSFYSSWCFVYVLVRTLVSPARSWRGHSIRAANCGQRSICRHPFLIIRLARVYLTP